ncbi:hypothetical protein [Methylobacterium frigidaeris]|uniref:Uncharacterized protein n=1 Tax=Methylobacterium frigidaeris TaxID=2038277 RepID=A0AA37HC41_9HYPH|nr:hypothetical protein [Methylobacterium frigidaeris]PIK68750.1 hypothetical protein CS379_33430 [Methylobacterium frigidaeris]GJD63252.1 hypothetical protein MPEAHAMD_3416 [Methylobacterium frigidaeris]
MVDAPTPDNTLLLRQMQGIRRDLHETHEREARLIELVNRLALRMDEGFGRVREEFGRVRENFGRVREDIGGVRGEVATLREDVESLQRDVDGLRGDLVLMENRALTAISETRRLPERVDGLTDDGE